MTKKRIAVFISGRGSNMDALIDACRAQDFPAEISLVLSNKPDAAGLTRAQDEGIATVTVSHKDYNNREDFDAKLEAILQENHINLVCLAGFMRLLTEDFVKNWEGKMINIHPSLLPSFKGLHTHQRAIDEGVKFTGCTVHFVVPEMDAGPIIIQAAVPIASGDSENTLGQRVLKQEHDIYPKALKWLASGRLSIDGHKVILDNESEPSQAVQNPKGL